MQQIPSQKVKRNSRRKSVAPESPGQNKRMNAIVETTRDGLPGQSGCLTPGSHRANHSLKLLLVGIADLTAKPPLVWVIVRGLDLQ